MSRRPETDRRRAHRLRQLKDDLPFFSKKCLTIRDKTGTLIPFGFNKAQIYAHRRLEDQKLSTGKVRALVLKGRQQGMSTYVSARFFHNTIFNPGCTTFILSHEAKTTGPLFDMVKRYYDHLPPVLAPELETANKNQLKLSNGSEYTVGTAGNEDIGRGFTIKQLHCSEAAWYGNTDNLETGLFQAVADFPETEIIHESTANGMNNMFYRKAMDAIHGRGEYILIFVPWFWQDEYRATPPPEFTLTPEEINLRNLYGLDIGQIAWRRNKITDFKGDLWKFKQEYPMNPLEAFVVSGISFFNAEVLMAARKRTLPDPALDPVIMGVDCARSNDRSVIVIRRGRKIIHYKTYKDLTDSGLDATQQLATCCAQAINKFNVDKCFIDFGTGYGVVDTLRSSGYKDIVRGVYFSEKALDPDTWLNKRSEMYHAARDWYEEGPVDIPDDDEYYADHLIIPRAKQTPSGKLVMPAKRDIIAESGFSPDITDAEVLTFAFPVKRAKLSGPNISRSRDTKRHDRPSELMTLNRIRKGQTTSTRTISVKVDH